MYYSDKYDYIPLGIVNKVITGCGISSFALENNEPVVLVVPTIGLIKNKVAQYPNSRRSNGIFGYYSTFNLNLDRWITKYLEINEVPKIMVTYDSFHKIVPYINNNYHIIVDEFSDLLDAYNYRNKAINSLLNELQQFDKVSYISATPIEEEFLPEVLKKLPYTTLEWDSVSKVTVEPYQTKRPIYAVLNIIEKYREDNMYIGELKSDAAYFFVNSVSLIRDILDKAEMLSSEVRIICSDTDQNRKKLGHYEISTSLDQEKTFNFITSCAFKGVDLYSETGLAIVISNNRNKHTLVSIDTDIYQVCGRIRTETNPFRNYLIHIFNENPLNITEDEFEEIVKIKTKTTEDWLSLYITGTEDQKKAAASGFTKESYLALNDNGVVYFDELLKLLEKRVFKNIIQVYKNGFSVNAFYENSNRFEINNTKSLKFKYIVTKNFKKTCELLLANEIDIETASNTFPLIKEVVEHLDLKDLKKLSFSQTKLRNAINNKKYSTTLNTEIKKLFNTEQFYSSKDVKIKLSSLYKNLGLDKKAKASDIEEVFNIKFSFKRINGKPVQGYQL